MQTCVILNVNVFQETQETLETKLHELSWNQIVQEEITNVVTTLRRNKRWSISSSYYQKPNLKPEPWMSMSDSPLFDYPQQVAQKSPFGFESLLEFHSHIAKANRYPYTVCPIFRIEIEINVMIRKILSFKPFLN